MDFIINELNYKISRTVKIKGTAKCEFYYNGFMWSLSYLKLKVVIFLTRILNVKIIGD